MGAHYDRFNTAMIILLGLLTVYAAEYGKSLALPARLCISWPRPVTFVAATEVTAEVRGGAQTLRAVYPNYTLHKNAVDDAEASVILLQLYLKALRMSECEEQPKAAGLCYKEQYGCV
jgi:hypothetical protein